jgi:uncharacterized protein DUF5658
MGAVSFGDAGQVAGGFCNESTAMGTRAPIVLSSGRSYSRVHYLLVLNLFLQLFDGLATYSGMHVGFGERNPLLRLAFGLWGIGPTLLLCKSFACATLMAIWLSAGQRLATAAFSLVAAVYGVCSFIPWSYGLCLWLAASF